MINSRMVSLSEDLMSVADKLGYKLSEFVVKKYISWGSHQEFSKYLSLIHI